MTPFHARMLCFHCFVSSSKTNMLAGDGNCLYRAFLAAVLEGLCQDPSKGQALLSALKTWHSTLAHGQLPGDLGIELRAHYLSQVHMGYCHFKVQN